MQAKTIAKILQELKGITNVQNKQISILNNSCELNEDLWQMLQNQSAIIGDLQNQQEQLENLTYLLQSKTDMNEHDDSVFEQEIYELFIKQERQIEHLMDRIGKEKN